MTGPATAYASVTREVHAIIERAPPGEREVAAYRIARAALLRIGVSRGVRVAAGAAYDLADELAVADMP